MAGADKTFTGLATALQGTFGQAVTYRRGSSSVSVTATIGATTFRIETEFGFERVVTRDYLIKTADLVIGGTAIEPARGDEIDEVRGTTTYTHRVVSINDEPEFTYSDSARTIMRIHTDERDKVTTT